MTRGALLVPALVVALTTSVVEPANAGCVRVLKPLIVQVGFADINRTPKRALIERRFVVGPDRYIREASYGKSCLNATITSNRYQLPGRIADYYVPWQNLKVDKNKLRRLVADVLVRLEKDHDVRRYDFLVFVLSANAHEWGNQGLNTYPGLLGWKDDSQLTAPSGRKINGGIAIYALSANVGKVFHNIAHIVAGVRNGRRVLPDMYDQDAASASTVKFGAAVVGEHARAELSMGSWDPMSCGMCKKLLDAPGLTSWTKLRLGWIDEDKIRTVKAGEQAEVRLGALGDSSAATHVIRLPLSENTYYLVENRQRLGLDRHLPASGVLIMYGDDTVPEPRKGKAPVRLVGVDVGGGPDAAVFDVGAKSTFRDPRHRVTVRVLRKTGSDYDIRVERELPPAVAAE